VPVKRTPAWRAGGVRVVDGMTAFGKNGSFAKHMNLKTLAQHLNVSVGTLGFRCLVDAVE